MCKKQAGFFKANCVGLCSACRHEDLQGDSLPKP